MRKYLVEDIPLFSIVAFSERCELKKVTVDSLDIYVIKLKDATPKESAKPDKDTLDSSEVADTTETPDLEDACPRCGSQLVLRTTKKGANAGKQFYGCSSFPKCRFTRDV